MQNLLWLHQNNTKLSYFKGSFKCTWKNAAFSTLVLKDVIGGTLATSYILSFTF